MELTELAQNYFGDTRSGSLAGPVGGLIIVLLAVATVLLIRNMNARLRRLPDRFPAAEAPAADRPGAAPADDRPAAAGAPPQSSAGSADAGGPDPRSP